MIGGFEQPQFQGEFTFDPDTNGMRIDMEGGRVWGTLYPEADVPYASLSKVEVDGGFQGSGRGEYLVRQFAVRADEHAAASLHSAVVNPTAMRIFERIFGDDNLTFVAYHGDEQHVLPINAEQAAASIALVNEYVDEHEDDDEEHEVVDESIHVFVDLTNEDVRNRLGLGPHEATTV